MLKLKNIIDAITTSPPLLPLVHTTTVRIMRDVINDGVLKPQECSVFKPSKLTYLYYCRPDYKPNSLPDYHSVPAAMPALFAFNGSSLQNYEITPFDTGAFISGMFDDHLYSGKGLRKEDDLIENYQLYSSLDSLSKYVQFMYGSNERYYSIQPTNPPFQEECLEAQNCYFLASQKVSMKYDRRCSSLEIRTSDDIQINSSNIAWALIPREADTLLGTEFRRLGIEVHTYYPPAMGKTDEYIGVIINEYRRILLSKALI